MVGQSCRETGTPAGWIKLGRQQLNRINLANEVLELKVRTPIESRPEDISEGKDEHTRFVGPSVHGCLTCRYQPRNVFARWHDGLVIDQRSAFGPHLAKVPAQIGIDALAVDMPLQDLQSHQVRRTEFCIVE